MSYTWYIDKALIAQRRQEMRRINEDGMEEVLVTFGHGTWQPESEPCWVTLEDYENPPECWTSRAHEVFDEE